MTNRDALARLAGVFGPALDLAAVRLVDSRLARLTGRAFVVRNTIHWPGPLSRSPSSTEMATLVHELAHCWQHQSGLRQLRRGVVEQALYTVFGWWLVRLGRTPWYDPYDYGGPEGLARTASLHDLRLEAQAAAIEHRWLAAHGSPSVRPDAASAADAAFVEDDGRPTPYALDLERLCTAAGLPPAVATGGARPRSRGRSR